VCLALFALDAHPRFVLIVAANRDEFHARQAAPAAWWSEGWLAGRDIEAGGTWFGVTRGGRWAFVTNVRDPSRNDPGAPSRGALVPALLKAAAPPVETFARVVAEAHRLNGFNLVAGTIAEACWGSNRVDATRALTPGIYGLSNAALDTPWPKVTRTKAALAAWCARADTDFADLFAMLGDEGAPDDALPATGLAPGANACCRRLSSSARPTVRAARRCSRSTATATLRSSSARSTRAATQRAMSTSASQSKSTRARTGDRSRSR
jgi:uncharacterized protein with NRDE domain